MEDFRRHGIATVIKTDKKDMLLTSKDPHFSHLYEQSGPNTPTNVSTENLTQSAIDVEGNYVEESTEHDYTLFPGQSGSYIQGFPADSPHLVIDVSCAETSTTGNKATRRSQNDENNNNTHEDGRKLYGNNQSRDLASIKKNEEHQSPSVLMTKHIGSRDSDKPQLLSNPADHYNMQLLAHSAQQLQQQQQQQRRQQELYSQESSSAALQNLARLHKLKQQNVEMVENQTTFTSKPGSYSTFPQNDNVKLEGSPKSVQLPPNSNPPGFGRHSFSPSSQASKQQGSGMLQYTNWAVTGRATPDFERGGHIRDLSFGSQDSPILGLQPSDIIKSNSKPYHKPQVTMTVPTVQADPEPELKSPLDHPDQLEQHRNRFFSSDSGPGSGGEQIAGEAVLNENDKKAVAAIGKLMEMGEKNSTTVHGSVAGVKVQSSTMSQHGFPVPINSGAPVQYNILQMHELIRNTPPPPYEQSNLLPGTLPMQFTSAQTPGSLAIGNSEVKQEPRSPSKVSKNFYLPEAGQYKHNQACNSVGLSEDQAKYLSEGNADLRGRNSGVHMANAVIPPEFYSVAQQSNNRAITSEKGTVPAKVPASRSRRTSSNSSNSNRRKSESGGSLTCGICGHSFRSTPALNGHMRVHSAPEKKQNKEERQGRTASHDSATKASPLSKSSISPQMQAYYDGTKMAASSLPIQHDPGLNADGTVRMVQYQLPPDAADSSPANRSHNGLLTMASAACFLKTKANKSEYLHPSPVLPPAYIVPNTILFPQPGVVPSSYHVDVLNPGAYGDSQGVSAPIDQSQLNEAQGVNYSQIYATPFQSLGNISFFAPQVAQPVVQQDPAAVYSANPQTQVQLLPGMDRDSMAVPSQDYVNQQQQQQDKVLPMGASHENFTSQYDPVQNTETNSLCQLASIAVAAANREYVPEEVPSNITASYPQASMQPSSVDPGNSSSAGMISVSISDPSRQECLGQEAVFRPQSLAAETSPLQSGNDPFFYPVTDQNQQQARYEDYSSIRGNVTGNRGSMVTWKDNVDTENYPLISTYNDPLMQEAVNAANPSKILPNSMMGGTPPTGTILSGARPFRQRHHSEGAHLIKNSESRMLTQILDNPSSAERPNSIEKHVDSKNRDAFGSQPADGLQITNVYTENLPVAQSSDLSAADKDIKKEEFWAEPKPIQRRRRRHSADSRLLLKPGPLTGSRQVHLAGNAAKKTSSLRGRPRRRPPPLVIPSSVNTFTTASSTHHNLYQSHLHHRRRPSGESSSSSINNFNDKIPPYTPPPMLSPIRAGSGLYCTTPVTPMFNRQKSTDGGIPTIMEVDESIEDDEELVRSSEPKINIGSRFQAQIPSMYPKGAVSRCRHNADKIWSCSGLNENSKCFRHVEQLVELSCSAVVPFGGSNKEFALDCIAQSGGDILSAVRRLITRKEKRSPKKKKNYTGSGEPWSSDEIKTFELAMLENRKDFFVISKKLKTRTTAECVDYYYHVIKRNRRRHRLPRRYRDQENDDFAVQLADSLHDSKNSASWSDDETTSRKSKVSADSDLGWLGIADSQSKSDAISFSSQSSPSSMSSSSHHTPAKLLKTRAARIQQGLLDSPVGSPVSTVSNDEQPAQIFSCPVCGKSFGKVKSRNAHMKTHGKQAQEKRRQREEEAARRREEAAASQSRTIPTHHSNFIHPGSVSAGKLFQHPQHPSHHQPQSRSDIVLPRFGTGM